MALTLAANINATQRNIRVTGTVPSDLEQGRQFRIGDELVEFFAFDRSTVPLIVAYMAGTRTNWRVTRGVGESVAASHLSGAALLGAQDAFTSGDDQDAPGPFPAGGTELSADIVDALEGAASPDAGNPFTTGIYTATKHLATADVIALGVPTTFEIAPAVPGSYYSVIAVDLRLNHGTTEFTVSDTSYIQVGAVGGGSNQNWLDLFAWGDFIVLDSDKTLGLGRAANPNALAVSTDDLVGKALAVWGTAAVTIADGDGSVDVEVVYRLVTP